MGTEWWIRADGCHASTLAKAETLVGRYENRFSRFLDTSKLSELNRCRRVDDADLAAVLTRALQVRTLTSGAFDPTLGDALIAAGYDSTFEGMHNHSPTTRRPSRPPVVTIRGPRVQLSGDGAVDLGGIAKGWTADRVSAFLSERGAGHAVVDAGGDIVVRSDDDAPVTIGLGVEGYSVGLAHGAVATSSVLKRRWSTSQGEMHHIISAESALPANAEYAVVSVVSRDATTADALATALIADPRRSMPAVVRLGAAALMADRDGSCFITPKMRALLR